MTNILTRAHRNSSISLFAALLAACGSKPEPSATAHASALSEPAPETIRVAIGTQDTTINCATGGPLVRELKLLEKDLPHTGKYSKRVQSHATPPAHTSGFDQPRVHLAQAPNSGALARRAAIART